MLWVLKRTVSLRRFSSAPKTYDKTAGLSEYLTGMRAICDYFETYLRHVLATEIRLCNHTHIAVTPKG